MSLPHASTHKKEDTKRLSNLPTYFVESFYTDWLDGIDFSCNTDFQTGNFKKHTKWEFKKYLLATSEFGQKIQVEIDLYITNDRLNEASFRQKLDPVPSTQYPVSKPNWTLI